MGWITKSAIQFLTASNTDKSLTVPQTKIFLKLLIQTTVVSQPRVEEKGRFRVQGKKWNIMLLLTVQ